MTPSARPWFHTTRAALLAGVICVAASSLLAARGGDQTRGAPGPAAGALPPVSMTCPMHPDVVESRAGSCPLCKMNLVPVRLDQSWMCPVHAVVIESQAGSCRLCGRGLVPVVVSLTWTCRGEVNAAFLEPGLCGDGSPRIGKRTLRPHGNHNPQHGGQFFMAPDTWHHLEGTLPRARTFRLHVYDDYARTLSAKDLGAVRGRVVTRERFDAATRTTTELAAFPLRPSKDGTALEATIDAASLPAALTVKVQFKPDAPEYRFDFTFPAFTREPQVTTGIAARAPATPRATTPTAQASAATGVTATPPEAAGPVTPLPGTMTEMLDALRGRRVEISDLIVKGDFGSVWVPAFQAKDLAIALETHVSHLDVRARGAAEPALMDVVRAAWLLDSVGDGGNREAVERAFGVFGDAVSRLLAAFSPEQP